MSSEDAIAAEHFVNCMAYFYTGLDMKKSVQDALLELLIDKMQEIEIRGVLETRPTNSKTQ